MHAQQDMSGIVTACSLSSCVTSTCSISDGNNCALAACLVPASISPARHVRAQDGEVHVVNWHTQTQEHGGNDTPCRMRRRRASYLDRSRWVLLLPKSASSHHAHSPFALEQLRDRPLLRHGRVAHRLKRSFRQTTPTVAYDEIRHG